MTELKFAGVQALPCPFCGGTDLEFWTRVMRYKIYYYVSCRNRYCDCGGPADLGQSGAIKKWNDAERETQ
jgi:hypothetical protein